MVLNNKELKGWTNYKISDIGVLEKITINPQNDYQLLYAEYSMPAYDHNQKPNFVYGNTMNSSRFKITAPVLLFNKLNVRQKRVWLIEDTPDNSVCSTEFLPFKSDKVNLFLLREILLSEKVTIYFEGISTGTSNSQKRISPNAFLDYEILLPDTIEEQNSIAKVLFDLNGLINNLQKIIEKKKSIKKGAMQELLTGKKRLPGFTGDWNKIKLSNKSTIKARIGWQGLSTTEYLEKGYAYLITGTDFHFGGINWNNCSYVSKERFEQDKNIQIKNEDILLTKDGSLGKVAFVSKLNIPATLNSGVFVIRPKQNFYYAKYVYYVLTSSIFAEFLSHLSAGSTIIHLYQKDIDKFEFIIPATIAEQKAIANILSDMDNEINALEKKLEKYRQIKQGMMEQLLSGKIRLVVTESAQVPEKLKLKGSGHNHQFDDAVTIAAIVNAFYSDRFPLGRKKVQKLLYLLRRKQESAVTEFKKKAAGPYADEIRYKGGEPIAKKNGYISVKSSKKGSVFSRGEKISDALEYVNKWELNDDINWLISNFRYTKTNILELLATIDMAICDLKTDELSISLQNIKNLIRSNKEWKAKLDKTYFSDRDIIWAMNECKRLFG